MMSNPDPLSSDAVNAAMSAVRQQMCNMVAAAQQHHPEGNNVIGGFHLPSHLSVHPNISIPKLGSPENLTPTKSSSSSHLAGGSPPSSASSAMHHMQQSHKNNNSQENSSSRGDDLCHSAGLSITRLASSPSTDAHDLRIISPEVSPPTSPTATQLLMEHHQRTGEASSQHFRSDSENVRHEKKKSTSPPSSLVDSYKDTPIKVEAECRGE